MSTDTLSTIILLANFITLIFLLSSKRNYDSAANEFRCEVSKIMDSTINMARLSHDMTEDHEVAMKKLGLIGQHCDQRMLHDTAAALAFKNGGESLSMLTDETLLRWCLYLEMSDAPVDVAGAFDIEHMAREATAIAEGD